MNCNNIFKICKKVITNRTIFRSYAYKTIKRPDPKKLKMPSPASAPSLMEILKEKIRLNGPLTVAEYMHIVITNPTEGYYMKKEVIGGSGDFITSPEISQLFGEMMAIWFYSETQKMYSGKPLQIVELGPGKGTLLIDILRVCIYIVILLIINIDTNHSNRTSSQNSEETLAHAKFCKKNIACIYFTACCNQLSLLQCYELCYIPTFKRSYIIFSLLYIHWLYQYKYLQE